MHPYVLLIQRVKKWAFKLALLWEFPVLTHSSAGLLQNDSAESEAHFRRCKVGSWAEASRNTQACVKMVKSKTQIENTGQSDFLLLFKEMRWAEMTSFYWDLPELHLLLHSLSYWTLIKTFILFLSIFQKLQQLLVCKFHSQVATCHATHPVLED